MYGIKFTVDWEDISFEGFSLTYEVNMDFSGSGVLYFEDFDKLIRKDECLNKDDFMDLLKEEYLTDFDHYEDTIHFNKEDLDFVYKEYVKQYIKEWD